MKKNARFEWGNEHQEAFDELKKALVNAPVLVTPSDDAQYILDADASETAMGPCYQLLSKGRNTSWHMRVEPLTSVRRIIALRGKSSSLLSIM